MRPILCLLVAVLATTAGHAQLGHDIARRHAARAGDKLAALVAVRAEGRTFINGEVVPFLLIAERPNRLRVESFTPLRRALQVYDGHSAAWASHSETKAGTPQDMPEVEAREFVANADFDGPLVDFAAKGYSIDYAGEDTIDGRPAAKLLVSRKDGVFFLWVDATTSEIVKRSVFRVSNGQRVAVETVFKDFRPVAGVLQPHQIETSANGQLLYVMVIDRMEANPVIPAGTFDRPKN
jgi:outer membrane lipoprotein-sorting protein